MKKEYFVDRLSNIRIQGPIVSLDLGRLKPDVGKKDEYKVADRLTITLTGQNFIALVTSLNRTVKAMVERQQKSTDASNLASSDTESNGTGT